jgi:hypothetical protein
MEDLEKLYNIYHSNIKVDQFPLNENMNPIKVGDLVVAIYNNKEIRGEVSAVFESYYLLKGKNGSTLKVTMDDVTEHYPKNRSFESKTFRRFTENVQQQPPEEEKPVGRVQQRKRRIIEEEENRQQENTPDNQVDLTIERSSTDNIKAIGRLVYYTDMKYSEITSMFEKRLLSKEEYWYLLTEKNSEIHIIRNNEKGFEIQPFVHALVGHFLKNKSLNEGANQIKISGNSNFSVVSNIPPNLKKPMLNSLIALLSGVKKGG